MKTTQILSGFIIFMWIGILNLQAQTPKGHCQGNPDGPMKHSMCQGIPGLSEDQQKKISDLRIAHQKEMMAFHNQMGELKAKQKTLTTADKPDMKAINANIDEISKLQNQMMKKAAEHQQQVRSLLTDEQKLWFDSKRDKKGCCGMGKMKYGDGGCPKQKKAGCPMQKDKD